MSLNISIIFNNDLGGFAMNTYIDTSWIGFNESDYIVGNTLNDVYLDLDSDGYRVLKDLYQSKRNYTISEIQEIYSDIEIEGFVKQMIDCNWL